MLTITVFLVTLVITVSWVFVVVVILRIVLGSFGIFYVLLRLGMYLQWS